MYSQGDLTAAHEVQGSSAGLQDDPLRLTSTLRQTEI